MDYSYNKLSFLAANISYLNCSYSMTVLCLQFVYDILAILNCMELSLNYIFVGWWVYAAI